MHQSNCPYCEQLIELPTEWGETKVPCPLCEKTVVVLCYEDWTDDEEYDAWMVIEFSKDEENNAPLT